VRIRENLCPISFYANLARKIHVGIELPVACITIAGNATGSWGAGVHGSWGAGVHGSWGAGVLGCTGASLS
jgi:hypothetical protein